MSSSSQRMRTRRSSTDRDEHSFSQANGTGLDGRRDPPCIFFLGCFRGACVVLYGTLSFTVCCGQFCMIVCLLSLSCPSSLTTIVREVGIEAYRTLRGGPSVGGCGVQPNLACPKPDGVEDVYCITAVEL